VLSMRQVCVRSCCCMRATPHSWRPQVRKAWMRANLGIHEATMMCVSSTAILLAKEVSSFPCAIQLKALSLYMLFC
jgi:hypothetical protein